MNEIDFRDLESIENYSIRFKCFDRPDGHQATFYICDKNNKDTSFKIDFEISGTQYNSEINNPGKSVKICIDEKFGNLENCFKETGIKYIKEKIKQKDLKNETVDILTLLEL